MLVRFGKEWTTLPLHSLYVLSWAILLFHSKHAHDAQNFRRERTAMLTTVEKKDNIQIEGNHSWTPLQMQDIPVVNADANKSSDGENNTKKKELLSLR